MQVIFVIIEYKMSHFFAVIPIFSVFGKFFAWELFVVIEHLWYYALNHKIYSPGGRHEIAFLSTFSHNGPQPILRK